MISMMQKCQHSQTHLKIQIRNVLRMWHQGSIVFILTSRKTNTVICKRTKITRNPCRKRTGEAVLGAEKFGDLTTADHKVLNEEGSQRDGVLKACLRRAAADTRGSRTCLCAVKI